MAGSCTTTYETKGNVRVYKWSWTSHTDGSVSEVGGLAGITGRLVAAMFVPATGDDQPSDQYDVVLNDQYAIDVLGGAGANLSQDQNGATNYSVLPFGTYFKRYLYDATLTPGVTNAGSGKKGDILILVEDL